MRGTSDQRIVMTRTVCKNYCAPLVIGIRHLYHEIYGLEEEKKVTKKSNMTGLLIAGSNMTGGGGKAGFNGTGVATGVVLGCDTRSEVHA